MDSMEILVNVISTEHNFSTELLFHSLNVAKLAKLIAEEMDLQKKDIELAYMAGIVHDVGKSVIPPNILYKPSSLTSEEWEIIKLHSVYSERIIEESFSSYLNNYEKDCSKIIRHHHESFDGSGYPDGLSGDGIPLISRIITISDIYDAITSPRIYRPNIIKDPLLILDSEKNKKIDAYIYEKFAKRILAENYAKL